MVLDKQCSKIKDLDHNDFRVPGKVGDDYKEVLRYFFNNYNRVINEETLKTAVLMNDITNDESRKIKKLMKILVLKNNMLITGKIGSNEVRDIQAIFLLIDDYIKQICELIGNININCGNQIIRMAVEMIYSCRNEFTEITKRVASPEYAKILAKKLNKKIVLNCKLPPLNTFRCEFIPKGSKFRYLFERFIEICRLILLSVADAEINQKLVVQLNEFLDRLENEHNIFVNEKHPTKMFIKNNLTKTKNILIVIYNNIGNINVYCGKNNKPQDSYIKYANDIGCYYKNLIKIIDDKIKSLT